MPSLWKANPKGQKFTRKSWAFPKLRAACTKGYRSEICCGRGLAHGWLDGQDMEGTKNEFGKVTG